jgi:two-component system sensor histidine kinase VicK
MVNVNDIFRLPAKAGGLKGKSFMHIFQTAILLVLILGCEKDNGYRESKDVSRLGAEIGDLLNVTKNYDSLRSYVDSVYREFPEKTLADEIGFNNIRYDICWKKGDFTCVSDIADRSLKLLEPHLGDSCYNALHARAFYQKGDALFQISNYQAAIRYFYTAKRFVPGSKEGCSDSNGFLYLHYNKMAEIWLIQENYPKAVQAYLQSIDSQMPCIHSFKGYAAVQTVLDNIGICYIKMKDADSAIYYFDSAISHINSQPKWQKENSAYIEEALGIIHGNRGEAEALRKNYPAAMKDFAISLYLNLEKGRNPIDARYTQLKMAEVQILDGNPERAKILLDQVRAASASLGIPELECRYLKVLSKYHVSSESYKEAFETYRRAQEMETGLKAKVKGLITNDLSSDIEAFDQQAILDAISEKNRSYFIALILTIVFLFISFILLAILAKSRKKIKMYSKESQLRYKEANAARIEIDEHNRNMKRIMGVVAHDMRSPISGIYQLCNQMSKSDQETESSKYCFELIGLSSRRLYDLTDELLQWNVSAQAARSRVDMVGMVRDCAELLLPIASEKGQTISMCSDTVIWSFVNEGQLWRVVNNLLVNAIKFSPAGSTVKIYFNHTAEWTEINIADEGIGIPEDMMEELFKPLSKSQRQGTSGENSHGFGLFISREIVESHGGHISVYSEVNRGSIFTVRLPIVK